MGFAIPLAVKQPFKFPRFLLRVIGLFLIGVFLNLTAKKFDFEVCNKVILLDSTYNGSITTNKHMLFSFSNLTYLIEIWGIKLQKIWSYVYGFGYYSLYGFNAIFYRLSQSL